MSSRAIPRLTVSIPTCERPELARRAVMSVVTAAGHPSATKVEIVVTDNSPDRATERLVTEALARWPGPSRYERNEPNVGMIGNFNRCIDLAQGRWVQILHDDDYLLPGGLGRLLARLPDEPVDAPALLFGVHVVDDRGKQLRRQVPRRRQILTPDVALQKHLTWSSFVRFPAIVVARDAYQQIGPFDDSVGAATDLEMWSRVFGTFGVCLEPASIVAYVVHSEAATESMFTERYLELIAEVFDRAVAMGVLPEADVRQAEAHWYHQFVIAGTIRRYRARDWQGAKSVMNLFDHQVTQGLPASRRWQPLRAALRLTTSMTRSQSA